MRRKGKYSLYCETLKIWFSSTVKKWENEFKCKLEYYIANQKAFKLCCIDCKMWESRINSMKNFEGYLHYKMITFQNVSRV